MNSSKESLISYLVTCIACEREREKETQGMSERSSPHTWLLAHGNKGQRSSMTADDRSSGDKRRARERGARGCQDAAPLLPVCESQHDNKQGDQHLKRTFRSGLRSSQSRPSGETCETQSCPRIRTASDCDGSRLDSRQPSSDAGGEQRRRGSERTCDSEVGAAALDRDDEDAAAAGDDGEAAAAVAAAAAAGEEGGRRWR